MLGTTTGTLVHTIIAPAGLSARASIRGVVVNVLNPNPRCSSSRSCPVRDLSRGSLALQIVLLGLTFAMLGLLSDGTYAVVTGTIADRPCARRRFLAAQRGISGRCSRPRGCRGDQDLISGRFRS